MTLRCDLAPGAIDLWLAYYDEIGDERLLESYRRILSEEERQQQIKFYFAADRLRYLVTRALVRTVLSRYVDLDAADWMFSKNEYGRPGVANPEAGGVSFNLSHTHHLIVLAVSRNRTVGVDVENVVARQAPLELADRFFAADEAAALLRQPSKRQQYRFFEYWTCKEAYIKARGMGLSLPLDKFAFRFPDERYLEIEVQPEIADDPRGWQFWQFQPSPEYLVALCAEESSAPPGLVIRKTVPLASEEVVTHRWLRTSERTRDIADRPRS